MARILFQLEAPPGEDRFRVLAASPKAAIEACGGVWYSGYHTCIATLTGWTRLGDELWEVVCRPAR